MINDERFSVLQAAVEEAKAGTDANLTFQRQVENDGGKNFPNLHVRYNGGNEYLRLDTLLQALGRAGKVALAEYRGRGTQETPSLVARVNLDGVDCHVVYWLA